MQRSSIDDLINEFVPCSTLSRVEPHATSYAAGPGSVAFILQYPKPGRTSCNICGANRIRECQEPCSTLSRVEPHATSLEQDGHNAHFSCSTLSRVEPHATPTFFEFCTLDD